jgi:hypothetical protein
VKEGVTLLLINTDRTWELIGTSVDVVTAWGAEIQAVIADAKPQTLGEREVNIGLLCRYTKALHK